MPCLPTTFRINRIYPDRNKHIFPHTAMQPILLMCPWLQPKIIHGDVLSPCRRIYNMTRRNTNISTKFSFMKRLQSVHEYKPIAPSGHIRMKVQNAPMLYEPKL
jgi:hypothetical protein